MALVAVVCGACVEFVPWVVLCVPLPAGAVVPAFVLVLAVTNTLAVFVEPQPLARTASPTSMQLGKRNALGTPGAYSTAA